MAYNLPFEVFLLTVRSFHEMKNIDSIMTILHKENNHEKSINWNRDFERRRITEHTQ